MEIETLKDLLYNQAVDGEFKNTGKMVKLLDKLNAEQEELLLACYWIGFNTQPYKEY